MRIPTRKIRIASQSACLALFFWLFLQTDYRGQDELAYPVSLLFRIDPLAALADALAPGDFGWALLWPALALLALTILFGRLFCGWVCPLGSTLDGCSSLVGGGRTKVSPAWRRVKYYLLAALAAAALFGLQLFGLFDPLSIFLRSLTISVYPAANLVANGVFDFLYDHRIPVISNAADAAYPLFRDHLLAFFQPAFTLSLFTFAFFLALVLLEKVERRFWCKNLCPLGALLGLCSVRSLVRRTGGSCADCCACAKSCRMDASPKEGHRKQECVLCLDCLEDCPEGRIAFRIGKGSRQASSIDLTRRGTVTALASGALLAPVARIAPEARLSNQYLLRPPGAVDEKEFQRRCIRCGECMKVCIGAGLHPAFLQAGATGIWTPLLVPRLGYCEYNCTLCGQVCPTGAIALLDKEEKKKKVLGLAVFDKNRCLPFASGEECLVCEEHCPTGEKAIVFEEKEVKAGGGTRKIKFPRVIKERCIGCGICETRCPLEGASAIRIIGEGETRRKRDLWA